MKRLIILIFLLQTLYAQGQCQIFDIWAETSGIPRTFFDSDGTPSDTCDALTTAYFGRLDAAGITYNAALKSEYDWRIFKPLRDSSLTDSLTGLFILVTDSSLGLADTTRLKQNLMSSSYAFSTVGASTWTLGQGITGSGTSYINTNFNINLSNQNSFCMFVYSRTDNAEEKKEMGIFNVGVYESILALSIVSGARFYYSINVVGSPQVANTDSRGLFGVTRYDANNIYAFKNGSQVATSATASITPISANIFVQAVNNGSGTALTPSTKQLSAYGYGLGLSTVGMRKLNNILEAWHDYKNIGVQ